MRVNSLPMTEIELVLKMLLAQRPDIKNKIPDAKALAEYIAWMVEEFGDAYKGKFTLESLRLPVAGASQRAMADRLMSNPMDLQAMSHLSANFALQSEHWYIQAGYDISMNRMLRYMPGQWHTTEYFEVYYAPEGPCPIHFEDEVITLSHGAILIVAPDIVHASPCYADDALLFSFLIRKSTFERVFWKQFSESSLLAAFFRKALSGESGASWLYFDTQEDEELWMICEGMLLEFQQAGSYNAQMMNTLLTLFFILVLKKYEHTAKLPWTSDFKWKHEYSAILSFIQQHYAQAGIEDVAREFGYSTRQISRILKECLGLTYAQLILKLRMEHSAALISKGQVPIAIVGSMVGYADTSSFYRAFTQYYGKTPKAYQAGK